ncbi:ABC transporter substrate-binding protein [Cohnella hongkongensis]|uniref:ABC transporter substrate-binding protein n=1 Tax=Cohnella hongkongensis TaxID=178337 RepID=A0ABV9F9L9_9BACL
MSDIQEPIEAIPYSVLENMSFRLRDIDRLGSGSGEWSLRMQFLESHMLLFMPSGQGWLTIDGRFVELRSGSVYVGFPGQLIEAAVHSLDERGLYCMSFDVFEREGTSEEDGMRIVKRNSRFPSPRENLPASPISVGVLCEAICEHWQSENGLRRFGGQIRFLELLYTIMQNDPGLQGNEYEASLEYVKDYIELHYMRKITIEELANVARVSPRHFMRLFKKRYGCSAIDYLAFHRIKQARMLMRTDRQYRLKDIARHVGYQDDLYFRRKFKQVSGIPPAAFIRNSRQKIVAYNSLAIGMLLALQIVPCAAPGSHPWTDYYRRKYETDKVIPLSDEIPARLEQLRLAKPDYIVTADVPASGEDHARLGEIAPVCEIPSQGRNWRTQLRFVAEFLGRTEVAEAWLDRYERKAELVREQIADSVKKDKLLIVRVRGEDLLVLGLRTIAAVFHEDLRIPSPVGAEQLWGRETVSLEELSELEADRLLLIVDEDAQSQAGWKSLIRRQQWRLMRAVKKGCVDLLPANPLIEYTAFTHELLLDEASKLWRDRT